MPSAPRLASTQSSTISKWRPDPSSDQGRSATPVTTLNERLYPYRTLLAGGVIYLLLHLTLRLSFSDTIQLDDVEQVLNGQFFSLYYGNAQPPLYSWISWLLFGLFGTSLATLTWLKYGLLGLSFWFGFSIARRLLPNPQWVKVASASWLLMAPFAWTMHQGFTHSILLGLAILMTFHAALLVKEQPSTPRYLYLGFAVGLGLLSKYSFVLFLLPLLGAALTLPRWRALLFDPRMLLALSLALVLASSHFLWLAAHWDGVAAGLGSKLPIPAEKGVWSHLSALGKFLLSALAFASPFVLVIGLLFPGLFRTAVERSDEERLLERFFLLLLPGLLVASVWVVLPKVQMRWFHPLLMLLPFWLLLRLSHAEVMGTRRLRWFWGISLGVSILVVAARLVQITVGPNLGLYGRLNYPVVETLTKLPAPLLNGDPVLVRDYVLWAHLLAHFPQARLVNETVTPEGKRPALLWGEEEMPGPIDPTQYRMEEVTTVVAGRFSYRIRYALPLSAD